MTQSQPFTLAAEMGVPVDQPLILDDPQAQHWDDTADLLVVGLGGAGIAAALEALERGLSVLALDRYEGGGSTAANGGVFYAGGGTSIQREAGETDTPEDMLNYLRIEAGEVAAEATLQRFVLESPETVDWILKHGGAFSATVWKEKCSYPPLDKFLYHPDNSLVASYRKRARPAARGHRAHGYDGKKAWGLGKFITAPLTQSALRLGLRFHPMTEARQLIQDRAGRVIGVRALSIPQATPEAEKFRRCIARANWWLALLPPSIPLASFTFAIGNHYLKQAMAIEASARVTRFYRAREGVLLSAGGFIMNPKMVARFAPAYAKGLPNGTLGDTGSGILLGMSAGGAVALMDKISAWRFINPPKAWSDAIVVNRAGERFVDETVYGATMGEHIGDHQGGRAWLIYDSSLRAQAFSQAFNPKLVPFQRDVTLLNLLFNATRAPTLAQLAARIGINADGLAATIATYNQAASGSIEDPLGKERSDIQPIAKPPFYAMDISVDSKFLPLPVITFGGLRVTEDRGEVLDEAGQPIPGLFAAGRCAVGIASQTYVSGLSFADCVFSGRRAARAMARANL